MKARNKIMSLMVALILMITVITSNGMDTNSIHAESITPKGTILTMYGITEETPSLLIKGKLIDRETRSFVNGITLRVNYYDNVRGGNLVESYQIISGSQQDNNFNVFANVNAWRNEVKLVEIILDQDVAEDVIMPSTSGNVGRINARYDANGGSFTNGTDKHLVKLYIGGTLSSFVGYEEPTKENATFSHWTQEKSSGLISWENQGKVIPESERGSNTISLKAVWIENTTEYDVFFESNGGTAVEALLGITAGSTISEPVNILKTGFKFDGWFTDSELTLPWQFATDTVQNTMTLYAKWTPRQYTDKFVDVMNQTLVEFTDLKYDAAVPTSYVNAMSKVGHSYKVFHDQNLTNVWNSQNFTVTEDTVLFVDYTKNDCVLSFETNGGTLIPRHEFQKGSLIGTEYITTKSGHTFEGWLLDAKFTTPVTNETVITENMTIYAKWNKNTDAVLPATGMSTTSYVFIGITAVIVGLGVVLWSQKNDDE
ncbi:InlB B-repeat-containing protein [Erysipelothrix aquatica]|uniref:InlB B-repeat-containing protein n=1 Tax=Erysipelothrix aquatica TaxID=2683714 RepID=UPI00135863A3|nr:InlB B-repeat-containing protein [Erysipelothrix aquatica]